MSPVMDATADFDGNPVSVGEARRFVRDALVRLDAETYEYATLQLVSELSTNAVIHARGPFQVRIEVSGDHLRLAVSDGSPRLPRTKRHSVGASTGRGLAIVAAMAADWGVERHPEGKTVWVVLQAGTAAEPVLDATQWESVLGLDGIGSPTASHPTPSDPPARGRRVDDMDSSRCQLGPELLPV